MLIKANTLIATYLYGQIKNCPCSFVWKLVFETCNAALSTVNVYSNFITVNFSYFSDCMIPSFVNCKVQNWQAGC